MFISNTGRNTRTSVKRKEFVKIANAFCVLASVLTPYATAETGRNIGCTLFSIVYLENN